MSLTEEERRLNEPLLTEEKREEKERLSEDVRRRKKKFYEKQLKKPLETLEKTRRRWKCLYILCILIIICLIAALIVAPSILAVNRVKAVGDLKFTDGDTFSAERDKIEKDYNSKIGWSIGGIAVGIVGFIALIIHTYINSDYYDYLVYYYDQLIV